MSKFRKKPVVIEAYQLPAAGEDVPDSFEQWCRAVGFVHWESGRDETLLIPTLEGVMEAQPGDWIIKGVKGEFYPCKPDIFAATYEPADAPEPPATPPEPIHWRAVVQAIRAVGAEAAMRGAMYPQTADEQREDKLAEQRVVEMIEWYATKGGAVAMRLPDWPRHPAA